VKYFEGCGSCPALCFASLSRSQHIASSSAGGGYGRGRGVGGVRAALFTCWGSFQAYLAGRQPSAFTYVFAPPPFLPYSCLTSTAVTAGGLQGLPISSTSRNAVGGAQQLSTGFYAAEEEEEGSHYSSHRLKLFNLGPNIASEFSNSHSVCGGDRHSRRICTSRLQCSTSGLESWSSPRCITWKCCRLITISTQNIEFK